MNAAGLDIMGPTGDVEEGPQVREWMKAIRSKLGEPDILVINPPGHSSRSRGFDGTSDEEFASSTNPWVMPIVHFLREALPNMKARRWGRVVNFGLEAMKTPHVTDPLYSPNMRVATVAMMKTLAHEYGRYNITFNTIATALILTPLAQAYMGDADVYSEDEMVGPTAVGRWGRPEELAAVAAFLCSSRPSWVTGETIQVDGGACHSLF